MSDLPGIIVLRVDGDGAWNLFRHEAGGHRWQRVPPTEKRDRTQTSTFTVAVFQDKQESSSFQESDIRFETTKGTGPGGQHRNKTESAVRAIYKPTGEMVFCQNNRSQHSNKAEAIRLLRQRVESSESNQKTAKVRQDRSEQIGSGQRGDKSRTIQMQNGKVTNHVNNKKMPVKSYLKGEIWKIH